MRTTAVALLMVVLYGCSNDGGAAPAENVADRGGEASYCVAAVRLQAFGGVESNRLEQGEPVEYENPAEAPAFKALVAAAPEEIQDELKIVYKVPPASREELVAASEAIEARLAKDCFLGRDVESPLSSECRDRSFEVQQLLASDREGSAATVESFGQECRPSTDPYESLSDECAGIVYGHFVTPSAEGVTNVGRPTHDQDQAISARFQAECDV